jgi:glycosyltransferase involved in cell wall biosynthesis
MSRSAAEAPAPVASGRTHAQPVRVMHLIHSMAYGGVETALLNWVRGLDRSRFEVRVVCFANPGGTEAPFVEAALRQGVTVSKVPWARRKPLLQAGRELAAQIRAFGADILHCHGWYADFVGAVTSWMVPVRTITTQYVWFDYDWKRNLIQLIDRFAIRRFDRVTAHCEATRRATIDRGFPPEQVRTLICGFETHRATLTLGERTQRRLARGVTENDLLLINVARLYPEKAQDFLLRGFQRILEAEPRARLWILGVGPLEGELRSLSQKLGLAHRVEFVGFEAKLAEVLALADLQVHPARIEGVPSPSARAWRPGCPSWPAPWEVCPRSSQPV